MATVELTTSAQVPRRAGGGARTGRTARRAGPWSRAASRRALSVRGERGSPETTPRGRAFVVIVHSNTALLLTVGLRPTAADRNVGGMTATFSN